MSWFARALAELRHGLAPEDGVRALSAAARARLSFASTRQIEGSVDLDSALAASAPQDPRWDYGVAYDGGCWFIEVHPATSGANLAEVIAKADWLRALLRDSTLRTRSRGMYWIASGSVSGDPAFARRRRLLAQSGVIGPMSSLTIP